MCKPTGLRSEFDIQWCLKSGRPKAELVQNLKSSIFRHKIAASLDRFTNKTV